MSPDRIYPPWSDDDATALDASQYDPNGHEFVCPRDHEWDVPLVAKSDGWRCPECGYRQTWAWRFQLEIGRARLAQGDLFAQEPTREP